MMELDSHRGLPEKPRVWGQVGTRHVSSGFPCLPALAGGVNSPTSGARRMLIFLFPLPSFQFPKLLVSS